MATKKRGATKLAFLGQLITGLTSSPPTAAKSLLVQGKAFTIAQLITALTAIQALLQAVVAAKGVWTKAVAAAKAQMPTNRAFLTAVRAALIQAYGSDTAGLAACGIVVKPPTRRTSVENTVSAAKTAQTKEANGTSKKAKPKHTVIVTDSNGNVIGASANAPVVAPNASVAAPPAVTAPVTNAEPAATPAAAPSSK